MRSNSQKADGQETDVLMELAPHCSFCCHPLVRPIYGITGRRSEECGRRVITETYYLPKRVILCASCFRKTGNWSKLAENYERMFFIYSPNPEELFVSVDEVCIE